MIVLVALLTAALAVAAGAVARWVDDPDRPERGEIIAALQRNPPTADVPDAAVGCLADWYLVHASPRQLEALLDGVTGTESTARDAALAPAAKTAILECLKEAA